MSASREDIRTILRQLFVRNMTSANADEAAERFLDLYFSDEAIDMSDANLTVNTLTSTYYANVATVNATTAVNTAGKVTCNNLTSTNYVNCVTVNGTTSLNTAGNANVNNLVATNYVNCVTANATTSLNTAGNANVNNLVATNYCNCVTINATTSLNTAGNGNVNNLVATNYVNCVTVNGTTSLNTAGNGNVNNLVATNYVNCATLNATTAINTAGNISGNWTNGTYMWGTTMLGTAGYINAATVNAITIKPMNCSFKSEKLTFTNVTGGATCTMVNAIVGPSYVIGVTSKITANVAGATSINVGDGSDDDEFGVLAGVVTPTNFTWSAFTPTLYAANTNIVLTAVGGGTTFDGNGNVEVTVTYITPDAP